MDKSFEQNSSNSSYKRPIGEAASSAHNAIDSATSASKPVVDQAARSAHQFTDKAASGASQAASALEQQGQKLKEGQAWLTETCRTQARENPLASLGVALVAGVALALLFKRH